MSWRTLVASLTVLCRVNYRWFTYWCVFCSAATGALVLPPSSSQAQSLVAAVLPSSRSVQVGQLATAFATLINTGTVTATGCQIAPPSSLPVTFAYQTTNPLTNALTGTANTPVTIPANQQQTFLLSFTPTAVFAPIDVQLSFTCANGASATSVTGLNTLLLSAAGAPVADVVTLAATITQDGIVNVDPGTGMGAFAVATVNVGSSAAITATANTGGASLPLIINLCVTDPTTGACLAPPAPSVTLDINSNATPTLGIFVTGTGTIPFNPETNRIFVRFASADGVVRGATSVAVRTAVTPPQITLAAPSRSTTIALTSDDRFAVLANRETNSLAVIEVRDTQGQDLAIKVAEVAVGQEPRYVAISPADHEAYVSNTVSGTVSVISLSAGQARLVANIPVGTEPRALAVTPNGTQLYVANHTDGTVSVIDVASRQVTATVQIGGNPAAIAITNNGDRNDTDETVFVTQFYAVLIPNGLGEGRDLGKQGVVRAFSVADPTNVATITLAPLANSGFTADRTNFCNQSRPGGPPANNSFCPDQTGTVPATSPTITQAPQGAYPNQLQSALIRGTRLFLPNIGAQPEPPVRFDTNVQPLVYVVDTTTETVLTNLIVNLNQQVSVERQAGNTAGLSGVFGNDIVALDANTAGTDFLIVSRGGNSVFRAAPDANGALSLNAPNIVRFQTGNIPNGVVISHDGKRAYTNNEVGVSVTAIALDTSTVLTTDIPSGEPPRPDTFEHIVLVGKLAFFTALGMPDNGLFDTEIRNIVPLNDKGKASSNGWSSCASCHPDGLADGVTWIFANGPRQTLPLDGLFAKDNPDDQKIVLWSATRGSNTDFNNNSRVVQGGCGFASDNFRGATPCSATAPANPAIYDHGITQGASDALDAQTLWVQTVRAPLLPQPTDIAARDRGAVVFNTRCATCHGGQKWTKSQVLYADNPAFVADPNGTPPGFPRDPGVSFSGAGGQIISYTVNGVTLRFLDSVGTFNASNLLEIRGPGALPASGAASFGALGFNVPSLLGTRYHAPYFHNGAAQTFTGSPGSDVFSLHLLSATPGPTIPSGTTTTIQTVLSAAESQDMLVFLNAIDGRTDSLASATDTFRDSIKQPASAQVRHANLTAAQEVPFGSVTSTAAGTLTLTIDAARTQVNFTLAVTTPLANITQGHIHIGPIGTNGPVVLDFCSNLATPPAGVPAPPPCPPAPFTLAGSFVAANLRPGAGAPAGVNNFTDAVNHILSGDAYANIHTQAFPNGEIRGQIEMP